MSPRFNGRRWPQIFAISCVLALSCGCATQGTGRKGALHGPNAIAAQAGEALASAGRRPDGMFLVDMAPGSDPSGGAKQLVEIFQESNCKDVAITIGSEDASAISSIVIGALEAVPPNTIAGCDIVVVAPAQAASVIITPAKHAGVNLIYSIYPAPCGPAMRSSRAWNRFVAQTAALFAASA